jgi:ElaA protein
MEIKVKLFYELNLEELYTLLQLRNAVFVVEQDCVYQDVDGKDQKALHVLGFDKSKLVAYTRIFKPGDYFSYASIGRVVVHQDARKKGLGEEIMKASIKAIEKAYSPTQIVVSAQTYLTRFYEALGFKQEGEGYLEDGIPHIKMIRQ